MIVAKPIGATPSLRGRDAKRVLDNMLKTQSRKPNKQEIAMAKSIKELRNSRRVYWFKGEVLGDVEKIIADRINLFKKEIAEIEPKVDAYRSHRLNVPHEMLIKYIILKAKVEALEGL